MPTAQVRVRFAETDAMGVVHHSTALVWFEIGRVELLRSWGIPYTQFEARGVASPVVEAHLRWAAPARFDDMVEIHAKVAEYTGARVRFEYQINRADDGSLICQGSTLHGFTGPAGRPSALGKLAPDLHQVIQERVEHVRI